MKSEKISSKRLARLNFVPPIAIIIALFVVAKLFFLARYHLLIWDEAVYLGMGKYIYSLGSSGLWEMLRPVGLPVAIGWIWKLGLPYAFISEIISLLFGVGNIALTYLIARKLFNKNVGVLAAALLAVSPVFFLYSSYLLTEVPSMFFALAAVYSLAKNRYYASGALAALAALFKFPQGLLLVVIAAALVSSHVLQRNKQLLPLISQLAKVASSFAVVTLPFLVFNYLFYRPFTSNPFDAIFRPYILGAWHQSNPAKVIPNQIYNYAFYIIEALKQHVAFVLVLVAFFLFFKRRWFLNSGHVLIGIFLAAYFAYFTYISNKDERFIILFLPFLCIFSAAALPELLERLRNRSGMRPVITGILVVMVGASFIFAVYHDVNFYKWRPASEPQVAAELYRSITGLGIKGAVLTSEPVFTAYNDNLFFPYYFTTYEGIPQELKPLNEWEQNKPFEAVIFSPQTLFCLEADTECTAARSRLSGFFAANYEPVFNGSYYDSKVTYFVYANTTLYHGAKK